MTIRDAISRVDALIHNTYTQQDKVEWLSNLDRKIEHEILGARENTFCASMEYDPDDSLDIELLVPAPYDEVYLRWLEAQIAYHNGEHDKYNAAIILYNTAYDAYAAYYNRAAAPGRRPRRFLF